MNDSSIALASSTVVFITSYVLLRLIKPPYVKVQMEDGSRVLAQEKLTLYSAIFGILAGLASIVLVGISRANRETKMKRMGML